MFGGALRQGPLISSASAMMVYGIGGPAWNPPSLELNHRADFRPYELGPGDHEGGVLIRRVHQSFALKAGSLLLTGPIMLREIQFVNLMGSWILSQLPGSQLMDRSAMWPGDNRHSSKQNAMFAPILNRIIPTFCLATWMAGTGAVAGNPPVLDLGVYAGFTITGAVGTVYSIEYVPDLGQTNDPSAWQCLEFLRLPASPSMWADRSAPAAIKRAYRVLEFSAPTNLVFIPPGGFRMGSPTNEMDRFEPEGPQTEVTISRGFWMGKYEVTQGEYEAVMGSNPSTFNGLRMNWPEPGTNTDFGIDLNRPVETVTWFDATNYCGRLTDRDRAAGRIPAGTAYRLPTEAEWEYACRAGASTRFCYGDDLDQTNLTNFAWYSVNSGHITHPVGQKLPNLWGLHDMLGNVKEWCQDWWADRLPGGSVLDPQGPASGSFRVIRGNYWNQWLALPTLSRSAFRSNNPARIPIVSIGFRVVLAPAQP